MENGGVASFASESGRWDRSMRSLGLKPKTLGTKALVAGAGN